MLKNYFKIAIAVLKRRKFFTFISLFGISFTLTILIVVTSIIDHVISPAYPEIKRERSLYLNLIEKTNEDHSSISRGQMSLYFLDNYVKTMKTPEMVSITADNSSNTYINNQKISLDIKYTNIAFWNVNEFEFLEGRAYNDKELTNADKVAVITDDLRKKYFGENEKAVGKYIEADNEEFRVTGVVKTAPSAFQFSEADIYVPYTTSKLDLYYKSLNGIYTAVILARSKADIPAIQQEYQNIIAKKPMLEKHYSELYSHADTYLTSYTRRAFGEGHNSGLIYVITAMSLIAFLFMLLPALNLININISRIMERSSEIGVRKAFGASSRTLVYQFIIENLILTVIGCVIGVLLAGVIITIINNSGIIPKSHLAINVRVLAAALLACIFFGLLTGVYPAWRMSKLQVVAALKAQ
ncbi:MAG: ABC transporter permease [Chitinophagaceae bacterium]